MLPVVLLFTLTIAVSVEAKEGFYLGASMLFNDIGGEVNSGGTIAAGNGAGIKGGYGFNRYVAVETAYWMTRHDQAGGQPLDLTGYTVDVKVTFPVAGSHIEPYLAAGAGNYLLDHSRGSGWQVGLGMDIYLFSALSFDLGWTMRTIDFGTAPRVSGSVASMDAGIVYHFP